MRGVNVLQPESERPRRALSKKVLCEAEDAVVDRASCLDNLRYKHRLGKQGIKFIDLSGPERSKFYSKAATIVRQSRTSSHGKQSPLSYNEGVRRIATQFGIIIDAKIDSQWIRSSLHNRMQSFDRLRHVVDALSAPSDTKCGELP
jgi:hypothetical protein